jgi:hypothetical protein
MCIQFNNNFTVIRFATYQYAVLCPFTIAIQELIFIGTVRHCHFPIAPPGVCLFPKSTAMSSSPDVMLECEVSSQKDL